MYSIDRVLLTTHMRTFLSGTYYIRLLGTRRGRGDLSFTLKHFNILLRETRPYPPPKGLNPSFLWSMGQFKLKVFSLLIIQNYIHIGYDTYRIWTNWPTRHGIYRWDTLWQNFLKKKEKNLIRFQNKKGVIRVGHKLLPPRTTSSFDITTGPVFTGQ